MEKEHQTLVEEELSKENIELQNIRKDLAELKAMLRGKNG
jgi:hypothetical protein